MAVHTGNEFERLETDSWLFAPPRVSDPWQLRSIANTFLLRMIILQMVVLLDRWIAATIGRRDALEENSQRERDFLHLKHRHFRSRRCST
jgi:hypothetical protein